MTVHPNRIKMVILAAVLFITAAFASGSACAHAVLISSTPKDNAVLSTPPAKVILNFDSRIEKRMSRVIIRDKANREVPLKTPRNGYTAGKANQLIIPLPKLQPGIYRLEYRVLATDGHITPGAIRFAVSRGKPN